ncbi:MAG: competence/damage-inducible protein A [Clostridia bacterium]|nr:competence/damage-inducible protein A [Clostridia bacterium]
MKAELVCTGTELLLGQILNTNAQYLSQQLSTIGVDVYFHTVVGDNPGRIKEAINQALKRADVVITTGGLGPTMDDLTKEMAVEALGLELELHQESLRIIEEFFRQRGRQMAENNRKQAMFPKEAIVLPNPMGTAPGAILERQGKWVVILPGPPFELRPMVENHVLPYLQKVIGIQPETILSRVVRLIGIGESQMEEKISDLILNQTNPTIAPLAKTGEVHIRVTAKTASGEEAGTLIDGVVKELENRLGRYIFGYDEESLELVVGRMLRERNLSIALAESCTGGLIASKLTDIAGSSDYVLYGVVSYSNQAKMDLLKVKEETLLAHGAVSEATAREMAQGVRAMGSANLGLAVTGIAGPGGGTPQKPVGLVYIALAFENNTLCKEFRFTGDRATIKLLTANVALNMVRTFLMEDSER